MLRIPKTVLITLILGLILESSVGAVMEPGVSAQQPSATELPANPDNNPPPVLDEAEVEADLANQQVSSVAQVRLEQARNSVVQIRGFLKKADSSAFHGSGFAVQSGSLISGLIVTNYHVVAPAVLHPLQYRLEYVTADGRTGQLQVYAIDIKNDLAIVRADDLQLPPLRLRTQVPRLGERAYSIGFPLNLGLTITEGVANGLVDNSFEQRIHYTGAINGGMSGGPALDARGAVYGVNVSVVTGRQLVGFVVPAKHVLPLLAHAREPFNRAHSPRQARELVAAQVLVHQARIFATVPEPIPTLTLSGYVLPTRIAPMTECSATGNVNVRPQVRMETVDCMLRARLRVQSGLEVGDIHVQHRILHGAQLHPLQFSRQLNLQVLNYRRYGSEQQLAPFTCNTALVALDGFKARVTTCVRPYRLFTSLYDLAVTVVSLNETQQAVISQLDLQGVSFEPGMQFIGRFLGAMRWTP